MEAGKFPIATHPNPMNAVAPQLEGLLTGADGRVTPEEISTIFAFSDAKRS